MYQKLDENTIQTLLDTGISEFAKKGLEKANIRDIAKKADLSVGVIYKYYGDKDSFFLACVEHSLKLLENVITEVLDKNLDAVDTMDALVEKLIDEADKHKNYYLMYHEITSSSCRKYAKELAFKIEESTAKLYSALIEKAQGAGIVKAEGDPRIFAFYFDNMLMMLQFSLTCDYYKERTKIYWGEAGLDEKVKEEIRETFVTFMRNALGIEV